MPQESNAANGSLISPQPVPAEVRAADELDAIVNWIATGLYSMASMLVGEGEESVRLVETAIANADISVCQSQQQARMSSRRALAVAALAVLAARTPGCLAAPVRVEMMGSCIDSDDLAAAGISSEELERMIAGPDRDRVREWLSSLPNRMRVVFVLRAVAGFSAVETAELLSAHGGTEVAAWTQDAARMVYRQGLCSLASQLLRASAAR